MNTRVSLTLTFPLAITLLTSVATAQSKIPNQYKKEGATYFTAGGFGASGAAVGDVDADSFEDYAISAPTWSVSGSPVGRVFVYSGRSGALITTFDGPGANANFGYTISAMGDSNFDGLPDIAIGSPDSSSGIYTKNGSVSGYSIYNTTPMWTVTGASNSSQLGRSLAETVDVNSDGSLDLVAGEIGWDNILANRGRVVFISAFGGTVLGYGQGLVAGDGMGETVAAHPLSPEVFMGNGDGTIYRVSLPVAGISTVSLFQNYPANGKGRAPLVMLPLADTTIGLAIGRPKADSGTFIDNGTIEVFNSGGVLVNTILGPLSGGASGSSIDSVPDMDHDGVEEIIYLSREGFNIGDGRIRIVTQSGALLEELTVTGGGTSIVAGIRDVTGDGRGDWLRFSNGQNGNTYEGALYGAGLQVLSVVQDGLGDTITFYGELGGQNYGFVYIQLYGSSGTTPGTFIPSWKWPLMPLNFDGLTEEATAYLGSPVLLDGIGAVSSTGQVLTHMQLDLQTALAFKGFTFESILVVIDVQNMNMFMTSNPVSVTLP